MTTEPIPEATSESLVPTLPGEDARLAPRPGGQPITPEEALGSWRRRVREDNAAFGRNEPIPTELPLPNEPGTKPMVSLRMPRRLQVMVWGKAEMEDRTLTEIVNEALSAYVASPPGTVPVYLTPRSKSSRGGRQRQRRV